MRPLMGDERFPEPQDTGEYVDLAEILGFLRRRMILMLAGAVAGAAVALFFAATSDRIYYAKMQILIEPNLPQQATNPTSGLATALDTAQVESQVAVLRSEKIAKMVIDRLELIEEPDFFLPGGITFTERLERAALRVVTALGQSEEDVPWLIDLFERRSRVADDRIPLTEFERERIALSLFYDALDIRRVGVSYALDIGFRSRNPELAARIANAIGDSFLREQVENKAAAARQSGDWLEDRMGELRRKMNVATQLAQEFRAHHDYRIRSPNARMVNGQMIFDEPEGVLPEEPTLEEMEVTADTYRRMYESFLLAYTNNLTQQSYPVADARVITAATRPLSPSAPRVKLHVAFGLAAGLALGVGAAFLRHALDGAIRSPGQLRSRLGLPCLGELPPVRRRAGASEAAAAPRSHFTAALRRAKFEIGLAANGEPVRRLGVTSVAAGEGKGEIAGNLALLYAMSGARTLLIDADAEHPVLSRRAVAATEPDPSGVVAKAHGAVDLLPSVAREEGEAGDLSRFADYDMIIVSLPPLEAGPERLALSARLDGVVMVAQWNRTSIDAAADLLSTLRGHDARVLGVLLTRVRHPSRRFYQISRQAV